MEQNDFINAMGEADIKEQLEKYKDNESVVKLLNGVLETRVREVAEAKAKAKFEKGIANLFKNLPHPEDVHNVYVRWGEVDVPDGDAEELQVTDPDGNVTTEVRQPSHKEYQWIVQVNKSVVISRGGGDNGARISKRAIVVMKRNGLALQPVGNFPSASKACEYLKIPLGGDSGNRVLAREGYITEAYEGTEYTTS